MEAPVVPLAELGLYHMLERIHKGIGTPLDFSRVSLIAGHSLGGSGLSEVGKLKLQALRARLGFVMDER